MDIIKKAIILDLDETLIHSYCEDNTTIMIIRPNLDKLEKKLLEIKNLNVDIILCTTSKSEWVNKFFELKPTFKKVFDKIYSRDNENIWRDYNENDFPTEYNAKKKNINLEYLKPITTFGYNKILYIDDNKLEEARLKILYEITKNCLNIDVTYFSGFKFYRKSNIWQKIINYNKKVIYNKYIEDYLEIENTNPGCEMIIESIEYFMNKKFKAELTLLDKIFVREYSAYENKLHEIESKIQEVGE